MRVHDVVVGVVLLMLPASTPAPALAHGSTADAAVQDGAALNPAVVPGSADAVLAAVRQATAKYLDIERARADGFVQISGMEARHGVHFLNVNAQMLSATAGVLASGRGLDAPPMLIYVPLAGGRWQLAAVEYALPSEPADDPFPGAVWNEHESSCHYRDYRELPSPTAASCPKRHPATGADFVLFHPRLWIAHVWAWYPNPLGVYAAENPYLGPYGGTVAEAHHARGRSGMEVAYSEFNHRSSGVILLAITALSFWQVARGRRGLWWRGVIGAAWITFGVYLFVRSDPEAWPWGPLGLAESLRDVEVLQHKILTLIPIAIGAAEALHGYGYLRGRPRTWLVAVLTLFGGAYLFLHFHRGQFHLDWIYAQHVAMGLVGLGVGAGLLLSRRAAPGSRLHFVWPAFLLLMSAVLVLYSEQ